MELMLTAQTEDWRVFQQIYRITLINCKSEISLKVIDWCLTPIVAVFQLYHGLEKFVVSVVKHNNPNPTNLDNNTFSL
jgi:hypothetical protein